MRNFLYCNNNTLLRLRLDTTHSKYVSNSSQNTIHPTRLSSTHPHYYIKLFQCRHTYYVPQSYALPVPQHVCQHRYHALGYKLTRRPAHISTKRIYKRVSLIHCCHPSCYKLARHSTHITCRHRNIPPSMLSPFSYFLVRSGIALHRSTFLAYADMELSKIDNTWKILRGKKNIETGLLLIGRSESLQACETG
jgi:hypothetical protein